MSSKRYFALALAACLWLVCPICIATAAGAAEPEAVAVWVSPGLWSYHFDRSAGYREDNWGPGLQLDLGRETALVGGSFVNSDRARSHYAGVLWQPWALGPVRLGAFGLAMDGYPLMRNGGWFAFPIPAASLRYDRVGVNLTVVPSYGKRLHGAVAAQFLLRVW